MAESQVEFKLPVDEDHVRRFAEAVQERDPYCSDPEEARLAGFPNIIAPPTFPVTQIFHLPRDEREQRLGANLNYERVLHGEQEFIYERLPFAGEELTGTMRISKDFTKEGKRGGNMRFVTYETVFTDSEGATVVTALYTLIETSKDAAS